MCRILLSPYLTLLSIRFNYWFAQNTVFPKFAVVYEDVVHDCDNFSGIQELSPSSHLTIKTMVGSTPSQVVHTIQGNLVSDLANYESIDHVLQVF